MAVTVATTGAGTFSATQDPAVTLDASPIEGDVIVVAFATTTAGTNPGDPSSGEWVNAIGAAGTDIEPTDGSFMVVAFTHIVTAAEDTANTTSWTLTGTFAAGETGDYVAVALRGVDTAAIVDGFGTYNEDANSTTHVLPAIASGDVSASDNYVLRFSGADGPSTYSTPTGHTQHATSNTNAGCWLGSRDTLTTSGVAVDATDITAGTSSEAIGISWSITAAAGGGPADLVVEDVTVATTVESVALTQVHQLVVEDLSVAVTVDSVALTQVHNLAVEDCTVAVTIDSITLTQVHSLVAEDLAVATTIGSVVLTVGGVDLEVEDLAVAVTVESVALTQVHNLTVADLAVSVTIESPVLTQVHELAVEDLTVAVTVDTITFVPDAQPETAPAAVTLAGATGATTLAGATRTVTFGGATYTATFRHATNTIGAT